MRLEALGQLKTIKNKFNCHKTRDSGVIVLC